MNADCAFVIGASHQICQDYARVTQTSGCVSAWLADGCSSSPDTDWGARLLVQTASVRAASLGAGDVPSWADDVARAAGDAARMLDLAPTCLDATLLGIVACPESGRVRVLMYGDGVAVLGRRDGTQEVHHVEYRRNYPLYLNYRNDPARAACWQSETSNERVTTVVRAGGVSKVQACHTDEPTVIESRLSELRYAMIFSDGVTSFTRPTEEGTVRVGCDWQDVLRELTAIKNWRGEWVARRLGRFGRDMLARGIRAGDDLAVAGVYFGE